MLTNTHQVCIFVNWYRRNAMYSEAWNYVNKWMEIHNNAMVHFMDPFKKMVITKHTFTIFSIFVSFFSLVCISQEMPWRFRFNWRSLNKIILKVWFRGDWYQKGSPPVAAHTCQGSPLARCYKSKTETVMKVNKWNQIKTGSPITGRATNGHWNGSNLFFLLCFQKNEGKSHQHW